MKLKSTSSQWRSSIRSFTPSHKLRYARTRVARNAKLLPNSTNHILHVMSRALEPHPTLLWKTPSCVFERRELLRQVQQQHTYRKKKKKNLFAFCSGPGVWCYLCKPFLEFRQMCESIYVPGYELGFYIEIRSEFFRDVWLERRRGNQTPFLCYYFSSFSPPEYPIFINYFELFYLLKYAHVITCAFLGVKWLNFGRYGFMVWV